MRQLAWKRQLPVQGIEASLIGKQFSSHKTSLTDLLSSLTNPQGLPTLVKCRAECRVLAKPVSKSTRIARSRRVFLRWLAHTPMEPRLLLTYPKVRSNPAKTMHNQIVLLKMTGRTLRCLIPVVCFTVSLMSQDGYQAKASVSPSVVHARAILGVEGISNNTNGELSIQGDGLIFKPADGPIARIPIASIQGLFLSQEDKEVGGTPLALGRAATPFGGGRAIGLFAHKKYDFLTLEYLDSNGSFHGAICQLDKGQGQGFGTELETKGVHVSGLKNDASRLETKNEAK